MPEWKQHTPSAKNAILKYECGLIAGQRLALRKEMVISDHSGNPTGEVNAKGETWIVLPGVRTDPVLWLQQPDGERHTWDDDIKSMEEWFEVIHS